MNDDYATIKSLIELFLEKMDVEADIDFIKGIEIPIFLIQTDEAGILIGEGGNNLFSLSHIFKKIAGRIFENQNKEMPAFTLDVNGYYSKRINNLKETAKMGAERARFFKKEVTMEPMNAFERRIVHTVLNECPDIKTESVGVEGRDRRIVIKPELFKS